MAMQKFTTRHGIMLLCGKLPPARPIAWKAIWARLAAFVWYALPGSEFVKAVVGDGVKTSPLLKFPWTRWLWIGISVVSRVMLSVPDICPRKYSEPPLNCP